MKQAKSNLKAPSGLEDRVGVNFSGLLAGRMAMELARPESEFRPCHAAILCLCDGGSVRHSHFFAPLLRHL